MITTSHINSIHLYINMFQFHWISMCFHYNFSNYPLEFPQYSTNMAIKIQPWISINATTFLHDFSTKFNHDNSHIHGPYLMVKGISTVTTPNGGDWIKPLIDPSEDDNKNDSLSFQVSEWRKFQLHGPKNGFRSRGVA